jgi:pimeloyl-ACP methyl ester carboxylesterase
VTILTGNDDWHIPPEMSQRLAKQFPEMVELQLLNGVGHNDILNDALLQVLEAMTPLNPSEK